MTASTPVGYRQGDGWVLFSGVVLILAGVMGILDGLWAIAQGDEQTLVQVNNHIVLWDDNLAVWGWIYLIGGIVVVLAGIGVLGRAEWATFVGILVAALWIIIRLPWIFAFPIVTLIGVVLAVLVIYGLAMYGGRASD